MVLLVTVATAAGCGSSAHSTTSAATATTLDPKAVAAFCADLDAPVPPISFGAPGTMTAEGLRNQFAAGLPHWEQLLQDAPPPAAASIAPVVAAIHQVVALDPSLSLDATSQAAESIMNAPELKSALVDLGQYATPLCRPGEGQDTTATTG